MPNLLHRQNTFGPACQLGPGHAMQQHSLQVPEAVHAVLGPGEPTPYLHLARAFEAMDATTKRLRISGGVGWGGAVRGGVGQGGAAACSVQCGPQVEPPPPQ
jgi:hypothetical protein